MASGTIERKCTKGHKKAEGRCSPRCVRWYPRIQRATPDGHGRRRFDYLGGYPTRAAARAALDQALGRQGDIANGDRANYPSYSSTGVGGPAPPTLNDLLDHWLAHLQTNKALRLRTIGRYRQLLEHHVRPQLIERTLAQTAYSGVFPQLKGSGRDRIRTCVGEAAGLQDRHRLAGPVLSPPGPDHRW
jgi:hypothetical protein